MGPATAIEIDAWLQSGGLVVTASDRAARALTIAFHRTRRAEGLTAWPAPNIQDWKSFLRSAWEERTQDGRLLLNPAQEQALWSAIAANSRHMATLLEGPRHRLAALAVEAHELLCSFAPQFLNSSARSGWQQDPRGFSEWLTAFDETCHSDNLLSPSRLPLELLPLLADSDQPARPPLLLVGFDRILPVQRSLLNAWGPWQQLASGEPAAQVTFYEAASPESELTACALWCNRELAASPQARLLIITQDAVKRRGEIERTFLQYAGLPHSGAAPLFEFSLGIPLSQVALVRGASLLLRRICGSAGHYARSAPSQPGAHPLDIGSLSEPVPCLATAGSLVAAHDRSPAHVEGSPRPPANSSGLGSPGSTVARRYGLAGLAAAFKRRISGRRPLGKSC
jgi:hypothetical protein